MVDAVSVRESNRALVLQQLVLAGAMPRSRLASETGLSIATVSRVVDDLIHLGLADEAGPVPSGRRGRNPAVVEFRGEGQVICGIDLGATNVRMVVSDLAGNVLRAERLPTPGDLDSKSLATWLHERAADELAPEERNLRATVVGVPGAVHPVTSEIRHADNLRALDGGPAFAGHLASVFPGRVVLGNDANLAVVGEAAFGAARGHESAVMFTVGTGIGTGVLVGGQPLTGHSGLVGEFAYLRLPQADGTSLPLEDMIGGPALLDRAAELGLQLTAPGDIFDASAPGVLKGLRQQALDAFHLLFTTVTLAYEPGIIVVGGGVSSSLSRWLPDLQNRLTAAVPEAPAVVRSELGDFAGALGALAVAWQEAMRGLGLTTPAVTSASAGRLGLIPQALAHRNHTNAREC